MRTARAKGLPPLHRRLAARAAERAAAGLDDHRPADRAAALGRGADRDGLRLARHRPGWRTRSSTATTRCSRAGSSSSRSSSCSSTCSSTSRTRSSTRGSGTRERRRARGPVERRARASRRAGSGATRGSRLRRNPGAIVGFALVGVVRARRRLRAADRAVRPARRRTCSLVTNGCCPGPSPHHWLGVDQLGRDELSRIIYGARFSLLIGVVAVRVGLSIGLLLGAIAGYFGGWRRRVDHAR